MKLRLDDTTDELRRLALQIAIQLPESVEDARRVLTMTRDCLENFMIEDGGSQTPLARARRLGWRLVASAEGVASPADEPPAPAALAVCWSLSTLLLTVPLALALIHTVGAGAVFSFALAVVVVAIVFGSGPAVPLACVSPIVHNFVIQPPALAFEVPSVPEFVWAAFYIAFAVLVPRLMRRRNDLRRLAFAPLRLVV